MAALPSLADDKLCQKWYRTDNYIRLYLRSIRYNSQNYIFCLEHKWYSKMHDFYRKKCLDNTKVQLKMPYWNIDLWAYNYCIRCASLYLPLFV